VAIIAAWARQHRQFEVDGETQLFLEDRLLAVAVEVFEVIVQADLAHRAELRMTDQAFEPFEQRSEMLRPVSRQVDRVQAQGGVKVRFVFHQCPDVFPVLAEHPQQHLPFHAPFAAALQYRGAVLLEVRAVEVVVGVDQAHRLTPCAV